MPAVIKRHNVSLFEKTTNVLKDSLKKLLEIKIRIPG
jgi:hypothetical protein